MHAGQRQPEADAPPQWHPEDQTVPYIPPGRRCYWGGWGGSVIISDLDRRATISYMMNKMAPGIIGSDRSEDYVRTVYACLDT